MHTLLRISSLLFVVAILCLGAGQFTCVQSSSESRTSSADFVPNDSPPGLMTVLRQHDRYSVLVNALKRTGIQQGLEMSPSYTLLVPTDSAFSSLDVPVSEMESHEVAEIIRNHIIQKALTTRQLRQHSKIENTRGISLRVGSDARTIGGAELRETNLAVKNGIVHGIGTVLVIKTEAEEGNVTSGWRTPR